LAVSEPAGSPDEQLIRLAFSLTSMPGAYAVLLGAGASIASGMPSAWKVLQDLLGRHASAKDVALESDDERMAWFRKEYGQEPTYEGILEHLAPTPHDRQAILKSYFEADSDERELGLKEPTRVHEAIAHLVEAGAINVVITLNFDNLIETALRAKGIQPIVVRGQSDFEGLPPLHSAQAVVVHLHGDYLAPGEMRNTVAELDNYTPATDRFLDRIMHDYGLVIVGWSATFDPKLREAMKRSFRRIYVPYWVEPGQPSSVATELGTWLNAAWVQATADDAISDLLTIFQALKDRAASRDPLAPAVVVATAKRELSGRYTAVSLHDILKRESDRLHANEDLLQSFTGDEAPDGYQKMVKRLEEASTVMAATVAATSYWGNEVTDTWWRREVQWLTRAPEFGSGQVRVLELHNLVAAQLFYSAGIAAVAAGRYESLRQLFAIEGEGQGFRRGLAVDTLDPVRLYQGFPSAGGRLFKHLRPLFTSHLSIGENLFRESWEEFEILRNLAAAAARPSAKNSLKAISHNRAEYHLAEQLRQQAESSGNADDLNKATADRRIKWQDLDRSIGDYANLVPFRTPHLQVVRGTELPERFESVRATRLIREISRLGESHPWIAADLIPGSPEEIQNMLRAANASLQRIVYDLNSRKGHLLTEISWLDEV
jgi:hypothetical protein